MADGWFDFGRAEELHSSQITRERFLLVNTSPLGQLDDASSSYASLDPGDISVGSADQMGPHFVMSGRTPDGSHTYGFAVAFITDGLSGTVAVPAVGGMTITPWILVGSLQIPNLPSGLRQQWISLGATTGVGLRERFHCFDVNACAIRFQIEGLATDGLIGIVFHEM